MEIRKLTINDISLVAKMIMDIADESDKEKPAPSEQHWEKVFAHPGCYFLAAFHSSSPVGYILAYRFPSIYAEEELTYLYDLEVKAENRQQGIGRQLVNTLLQYLRNDGVKEVWLGTETDNLPAQKLYLATGATQEDEAFLEFTYYL